MLGWFDTAAAKKFGAELADLFIERTAPGSASETGKLLRKKAKALEHKVTQRILEFKKAHSLNIYKIAQVGISFKEAMLMAGHDSEYVNELTHWIVLQLKTLDSA